MEPKGENTLGVLYALVFILLSISGAVVCLVVPRFRPYVLRTLVVPVAFGFCSVVAMVALVVIFDTGPLVGFSGLVVGLAIYVFPGVLGAWIALSLARRIEGR